MSDAAASPPAEAPPAAAKGGEATPSSAVPVFTLEYPQLLVAYGRTAWHGPNPKLLVQLTGATVLLMTFTFLYAGVSWNPSARLKTLQVAVLSCDAGVPSALAAALPALAAAPPMGCVPPVG